MERNCPKCGKTMHHVVETTPGGTVYDYLMCPCSLFDPLSLLDSNQQPSGVTPLADVTSEKPVDWEECPACHGAEGRIEEGDVWVDCDHCGGSGGWSVS